MMQTVELAGWLCQLGGCGPKTSSGHPHQPRGGLPHAVPRMARLKLGSLAEAVSWCIAAPRDETGQHRWCMPFLYVSHIWRALLAPHFLRIVCRLIQGSEFQSENLAPRPVVLFTGGTPTLPHCVSSLSSLHGRWKERTFARAVLEFADVPQLEGICLTVTGL